jgi:transposase
MPAATKRAPQAADDKPEPEKHVGIAELAQHLGTEPRTLRVFLRRNKRSVGRGARYSWPSLNDPEAEKIAAEWSAAGTADEEKPS